MLGLLTDISVSRIRQSQIALPLRYIKLERRCQHEVAVQCRNLPTA